MKISDVLRDKGGQVVTTRPERTVAHLVRELAEHGVGALVVTDAAGRIAGIVSERDVVRRLDDRGAALLDAPIGDIMTESVSTCSPGDSLDDVMRVMTERRIRHLPVLRDGELAGIVSIGDVVKTRIGELQATTDQLTSYITGG
ncbi:MAG: CBS domain-containing protein [Actinomycetota bacterium]|nr:CBS domain-containing protein [Actinomycetota bacterium]